MNLARRIKDVDSWDGSAARWPDADSYCAACLIDVNPAGEAKTKSLCKLPVREPGDSAGTYVRQAVHAAVGGRGITAVEKPAGVSQSTWAAAVKSAANKLIGAYGQMDEVAPDSVYEIAGRTPPAERRNLLRRLWDTLRGQPARAMGSMELWGKVAEYVHATYNAPAEVDSDAPMTMYEEYEDMEPDEDYTFLVDVFADAGEVFAVLSRAGKLYRADVTISGNDVTLGELVEVMTTFTPTESRCLVTRQADGRDRWLIVTGTSVLNRQAEIDSAELFDNFIRRAEETGRYPYLTFFHLKEAMAMGRADFLARDGVVYIASGLFYDSDLARATALALQRDPDFWGASNSFYPLAGTAVEVAPDVRVPVYTDGEHEEISILPERDACSLFTRAKGVNRMNEKIRAALVALTGGDEAQANEFAALVDDINRTVTEEGLIHRETAETSPETDTVAETVTETTERADEIPAIETVTLDDAAIAAIADAFMQRPEVQELFGLGARLAELERRINESGAQNAQATQALAGRLAELERANDSAARVIAADMPRSRNLNVTHRPRSGAAVSDGKQQSYADLAAATLAQLP